MRTREEQRAARAPGEEYNPGPADAAAPGRERDPAARRRRGARGAARQAHAEGALHGRRVGVPRRRRRRAARATATRRTAPPPCASCARRPRSRSRTPTRSSSSRAGSRPRRCRSASTPTSSSPRCRPARSRGSTARSASTSAGSRRAAALEAHARRRDRAGVPDDQAPRAAQRVRLRRRRCSPTRAGATCSRSSRGSCSRARSRAILLPGEPGY